MSVASAKSVDENEEQRLESLYELGILDSAREKSFDELARLAARLSGCRRALIVFVDGKRVWVQADFQMPVQQMPREKDFFEHGLMDGGDFFAIGDLSLRPEFQNHPWVAGELGVRFFASVPIRSLGGWVVGLICVLDSEPIEMKLRERESLQALATVTACLLEERKKGLQFLDLLNRSKELEQSLVRDSQISSLAEVAGGLAHEIKNPLSVIHFSVSCLRKFWLEGGSTEDKIIPFFNRLESAVTRINHITSGLQSYARDASEDSSVSVTFHEILKETLIFCEQSLRENAVALKVNEAFLDFVLVCRPVEISQILLNLIANAIDAIRSQAERWIEISASERGLFLEISVTDSGGGIPLQIRRRIFEPFFTTKELQKGTGLGLSICRSLAHRHGGDLEMDTSGPNTRFILRLPKPGQIAV